MSQKYWILIILLIIGSVSLSVTIFLLSKPKNKDITQQTQLNTPPPIIPPIDINAASVSNVSLLYQFTGSILQINKVTEGVEIITNIQTPNIPKFIVCTTCQPSTQVFGMFSNGFRQVNLEQLQVNQDLRIFTNYNLKTNQWQITRVNILNTLVLPTSPPRGIQPQEQTQPSPISPTP